jgi:hypothetical protein
LSSILRVTGNWASRSRLARLSLSVAWKRWSPMVIAILI